MNDKLKHPPLPAGDPRLSLWSNGRRVSAWWVETDHNGQQFNRRWVLEPNGWDYEDRPLGEPL